MIHESGGGKELLAFTGKGEPQRYLYVTNPPGNTVSMFSISTECPRISARSGFMGTIDTPITGFMIPTFRFGAMPHGTTMTIMPYSLRRGISYFSRKVRRGWLLS